MQAPPVDHLILPATQDLGLPEYRQQDGCGTTAAPLPKKAITAHQLDRRLPRRRLGERHHGLRKQDRALAASEIHAPQDTGRHAAECKDDKNREAPEGPVLRILGVEWQNGLAVRKRSAV